MTEKPSSSCPVCHIDAPAFDVLDFNKSCAENTGFCLPLSGIPVYYHRCPDCGFCFAPEIAAWSPEEMAARIYNDEYVNVDPDYVEQRPKVCAAFMDDLFGSRTLDVPHLDYGSGSGILTRELQRLGWDSTSYDPFSNPTPLPAGKKFGLVTAFEVFEHAADVRGLVREIESVMADESILYISTVLSDESIVPGFRIVWWYASPRNGHISLFTSASLRMLLEGVGLTLVSINPGNHIAFRRLPRWAEEVFAEPISRAA